LLIFKQKYNLNRNKKAFYVFYQYFIQKYFSAKISHLEFKSLPKFLNPLLGIQLGKNNTEIIKNKHILCQ